MWTDEVDNQLNDYVTSMYDEAASAIVMSITSLFPVLSVTQIPPTTSFEIIIAARNRLVGVSDHIWEVARTELSIGMQKGESIPQLRNRIIQSAQLSAPRATTIARTEVIGAMNAASTTQVKFSGMRGTKEWMSTPDARTRPTHRIAAGQTVPLGSKFAIGDTWLDHPGDPSGSPEEIVNCRCSIGFNLDPPHVGTVVASGGYTPYVRRWHSEFCKAPKHPGPCKGYKGTTPTKESSSAKTTTTTEHHGGGGGGGVAPVAGMSHEISAHPTIGIDHIPDAEQKKIYDKFKGFTTKGMSPCWPASKIYDGVQHTKTGDSEHAKLTDAQVLKVLDKQHALAGKKGGESPYTDKVTDWVKTPKGTKAVLEAHANAKSTHDTITKTNPVASHTATPLKKTVSAEKKAPQTHNEVKTPTASTSHIGIRPISAHEGADASIAHVPQSTKDVVIMAANKHGLSPTSEPSEIYAKTSVMAAVTGMSHADVLRVLDEHHTAQSGATTNTHAYTKRTVDYLSTSNGKAHAITGKAPTSSIKTKTSPPAVSTPMSPHKGAAVSIVPTSSSVHEPSGVPQYKNPSYDSSIPSSEFAHITAKRADTLQSFAEPWTTKSHEAIRSYTSVAYVPMNSYLRTGSTSKYLREGSPEAKSMIDEVHHVQAAMRPIPQHVLTSRGTNLRAFGIANGAELHALVGKTVQDKGFTSTSYSQRSFVGEVKMKIEVPKGTHGAFVSAVSEHENENELLLAAGTKFRILAVTPPTSSKGAWRVRARVVGD
jgi:hypothetical protein